MQQLTELGGRGGSCRPPTDGTSRQTNATKSCCTKTAAGLCPHGPHGPHGHTGPWGTSCPSALFCQHEAPSLEFAEEQQHQLIGNQSYTNPERSDTASCLRCPGPVLGPSSSCPRPVLVLVLSSSSSWSPAASAEPSTSLVRTKFLKLYSNFCPGEGRWAGPPADGHTLAANGKAAGQRSWISFQEQRRTKSIWCPGHLLSPSFS